MSQLKIFTPEKLQISADSVDKHYWQDLWRYRELLYILSWRDIKVRYKQTVFGAAWSIIRPMLATIFFTIVFHKLARMEAPENVPYAVLVFAGMLPWQFFSNALSESGNSLVGNAGLISKVYFPRMIIPASAIITGLVDFCISLALLIGVCIFFRYMPPLQIIFIPLFLILAVITSFGIGLWVSALQVSYRDFRFIIPFLIQFGMYITPVGFSSELIPDKWRLLYACNPMVGVIDGFRWCILGQPVQFPSMLISIAVSFLFLGSGIRYFRTTEKSFADII
ncbi:MAG: ABC transporter permease [Chitinophagaceae bacterium]